MIRASGGAGVGASLTLFLSACAGGSAATPVPLPTPTPVSEAPSAAATSVAAPPTPAPPSSADAAPPKLPFVNPVTSLDPVPLAARPSASGLEIVLGGGLTTGSTRVTADVPPGALTVSSCGARKPRLASIRVTGCLRNAADADAMTTWANAHNERALVECAGYRFVGVKAVTAAAGSARVADGSASTTPGGQRIIAGASLGTTIPNDAESYFPKPAREGLSASNIFRGDEHFVVDASGVLHSATFTVHDDRNVTATLCQCPTCLGGSGRAVSSSYVVTQTWYAIPDAIQVGPPLAFALDYGYVYVNPPATCSICPPPP